MHCSKVGGAVQALYLHALHSPGLSGVQAPETSLFTMPIYAYKCDSCGFSKDVLQKMSDSLLSVCPQCSASTFKKQLTAAGFQLKGSGWYATDFRGGNNAAPTANPADASTAGSADAANRPNDAGSQSAPAATPSAAAAPSTASDASTGGKRSKNTSGNAASKSS